TERAGLLAREQALRSQAESLAELARQGAVEPDTDRAAARILEVAERLLATDLATIVIVDSNGMSWMRGVRGVEYDEWSQIRRVRARGPVSRVMEDRKTLVFEDIDLVPNEVTGGMPVFRRTGIHAALFAPLISRDRVLGVMILGWKSVRALTSEETDLV